MATRQQLCGGPKASPPVAELLDKFAALNPMW